MRFIYFFIAVIAGFFVPAGLHYGSSLLGLVPDLGGDDITLFQFWAYGGALWAWIAGSICGLGIFFVDDEKARRNWLALPVIAPLFYCLSVYAYFWATPRF